MAIDGRRYQYTKIGDCIPVVVTAILILAVLVAALMYAAPAENREIDEHSAWYTSLETATL